ncbi:hypothetical protein ABT392_05650 [Paucibacter sp. JuS9]|uniref:hypothetical protein n=1 Tax=Paucibacter sp. JuS9 TaxID=3228748 RepID=UPI00375686E6
MLIRRQNPVAVNGAHSTRKPAHLGKWAAPTGLNPKEDAWWSRRLASGSDWMDEWISKPTRR